MDRELALFLGKTLFSALLIAGLSSLATRFPVFAGYLVALPLATILSLSFTYAQTGNGAQASTFALSILSAIPISLLFFLPFLFYARFKGSFWLYLLAGVALLYAGFFVHRAIASRLFT
ncbi:hypothetical protein D3C87_704000 [compost metagenome]